MKRVVVIHGTSGTPEENWFPWLRSKVKTTGSRFVMPQFPHDEAQTLPNWQAVFDREVGSLTPETILIGHSVGAVMALRLLEQVVQPVTATFLVAGFTTLLDLPDIDPLVATFVEQPFDWPRIKAMAGAAHVYQGSDDPYVPRHHADEISARLGTKPIIIAGGGHLNRKTGYGPFEALWAGVEPLLDRAPKSP